MAMHKSQLNYQEPYQPNSDDSSYKTFSSYENNNKSNEENSPEPSKNGTSDNDNQFIVTKEDGYQSDEQNQQINEQDHQGSQQICHQRSVQKTHSRFRSREVSDVVR